MSEWLYDRPQLPIPAYNISGRELVKEQQNAALQPKITPLTIETGSPSIPTVDDSLTRGMRLFNQCSSCHTSTENGPNRVGPNLWNIVNRPVASLENYRYSRALSALGQSGAIWDETRLNAYLTSPSQLVIGTTMAFRGLSDAKARDDIITYLRSLIAPASQADDKNE